MTHETSSGSRLDEREVDGTSRVRTPRVDRRARVQRALQAAMLTSRSRTPSSGGMVMWLASTARPTRGRDTGARSARFAARRFFHGAHPAGRGVRAHTTSGLTSRCRARRAPVIGREVELREVVSVELHLGTRVPRCSRARGTVERSSRSRASTWRRPTTAAGRASSRRGTSRPRRPARSRRAGSWISVTSA